MQLKSYLIVMIAILIQSIPPLTKKQKFMVKCLCVVGLAYIYPWAYNHIVGFASDRGPAWIETINMSLQHPFIGWGIGTYKVTFDTLANLTPATRSAGHWLNAHNDFLQMMYETGFTGYLMLCLFGVSLLRKCRGALLIGAIMVIYTMAVHFPMRQTNTVPLLILFVAYIERKHLCRHQAKLK